MKNYVESNGDEAMGWVRVVCAGVEWGIANIVSTKWEGFFLKQLWRNSISQTTTGWNKGNYDLPFP